MSERPPLARSELEVARIVWSKGSATVREVLDELPGDRDLNVKTVQTYLRRLEAKGYVRSRKQGRSKVYLPRVRPRLVVYEIVEDFIERLFDGEAIPLLQHLIQDRGLSDKEHCELRQMLERLEAESDESDE